jgi:hypothetical protein
MNRVVVAIEEHKKRKEETQKAQFLDDFFALFVFPTAPHLSHCATARGTDQARMPFTTSPETLVNRASIPWNFTVSRR